MILGVEVVQSSLDLNSKEFLTLRRVYVDLEEEIGIHLPYFLCEKDVYLLALKGPNTFRLRGQIKEDDPNRTRCCIETWVY